jgi:hypothetical protein
MASYHASQHDPPGLTHWNRLGIDPHVTFDDLKAAAVTGNSSDLISG